MTVALTLLEDVRWRGTTVVGRACAGAAGGAGAPGAAVPVRAERLIELVWGDEAPANATKSLQVLVSRTRTALWRGRDRPRRRPATGSASTPPRSTALRLARARARRRRGAGRATPTARRALAREALALAQRRCSRRRATTGPLADVRRAAAARRRGRARDPRAGLEPHGRARRGACRRSRPRTPSAPTTSRCSPTCCAARPPSRGPGAALERFERYRRDLRERLGANPGERLQRAHRDLLALDQPVRSGVRYDASSLLGRDRDVERLPRAAGRARAWSRSSGPAGSARRGSRTCSRATPSQPVVHVVELVGVTAAEDVVGEVGSVLGVRDSVSGRRTL